MDPTASQQSPANSSHPENPLLRALKTTVKALARLWVGCTSLLGSLVLLALFVFIFFFWGAGASDKVLEGTGPDKIAVVNLSGVIDEAASAPNLVSGSTDTITPDLVQDYLDRAAADKNVRAIIFRLNSPGGTIVASDQIYEKIATVKKTKKIIFLYGDVAASGGYYISSLADKIVANPTTITGSIGVIAEVLNVKGLYDKLGLSEEVYKTGPNKDLLNPARDRTQEEKDIIQKLLDQGLEQFIDRVASGRGLDKDKVKSLADGRIYSGLDAQKLGLVDELGNLDKAIEVAKKTAGLTKATIVEYSPPSFWSSLLSGRVGSINLLSLFSQPTSSTGVKIQYLLNL